MDKLVTIAQNMTAEIVEKKSKFIANVIYIESAKQAEEEIHYIKKQNPGARHNCYAYRVLENGQVIERQSDDGEPSRNSRCSFVQYIKKE